MQYEKLQKVWYINHNKELKFLGLILEVGTDIKLPEDVYEIFVYFGGVWETLIATAKDITPRELDMGHAMFAFRKETMEIDKIEYDYHK